ncbi:uncharacterized protein LOC119689740 [Teleopsis dalmanni]|uniref:uncharacterized protein LOC119689740 n=1 Tax=Teleopsis dalmanni TaxID=139649 RepID=UPI000D32AC45|nr:uncharacterized protein LOC119689740 [Teleopsis dalmanni]
MVSDEKNCKLPQPGAPLKNYIKLEFRSSFDLVNQERLLKVKTLTYFGLLIKIRALAANLETNANTINVMSQAISKQSKRIRFIKSKFENSIAASKLYHLLIANHLFKKQDRIPNRRGRYVYCGSLEAEITERLEDLISEEEYSLEQFSKIRNFQESEIYLLNHTELLNWKIVDFVITQILCFKVEKTYQKLNDAAFQCVTLVIILHYMEKSHRNPTECIKKFFTDIKVNRHYRLKFLLKQDLLVLGIKTMEKVLKSTNNQQILNEPLDIVVYDLDDEDTSDSESGTEDTE